MLGASFLDMNITASDGYDVNNESPGKQFQLHNYFDLGRELELDLLVYYVDTINVQYRSQTIPSYIRADVRMGWKPFSGGELSFGVRNAADDRHAEIGNLPYVVASQIERSIYLKWTQSF